MAKFTGEAKKVLLIRHTDLDGFAAGAVIVNSPLVSEYVGEYVGMMDPREEITDLPYCYNGGEYFDTCVKDHIDAGALIFIVDISISNANINHFASIIEYAGKNANMVVWFDHHASSLEWTQMSELGKTFAKNIVSRIDTSRSGAYISYNEMFDCYEDKDILNVIRYVDDHDRFIHSMPESIYLNDATFLKKFAFLKDPLSDEWRTLIREENPTILDEALISGKAYHEFLEEEYSGYYAKNHFKILLEMIILDDAEIIQDGENKYYGGEPKSADVRYLAMSVLNRSGNSMMFGDDYNRMDACVTFINRPMTRYSMYSSNKNINCGKFAAILNGGGHAGAAGTPNMALFNEYILHTYYMEDDNDDDEKIRFNLTNNITPISPIPMETGDIKYATRICMTKSAANQLISSDETFGDKLVIDNNIDINDLAKEILDGANYFESGKLAFEILHYDNTDGFIWLTT